MNHRHVAEPRRVLAGSLVAVVVLLLAAAVYVVGLGQDVTTTERQVAGVSGVAVDTGDRVLRLCAANPELAVRINAADPDLCASAARVRQRVADAGGSPQATPPAADGVNRDELVAHVRTAVSAYCGAHADCAPTYQVVTRAVGEYLAAHPPAGVPPTRQQIVDAVELVVAADPGLFRGERGPGPTDEQVGAAVDEFCAAHGGCAGPAGPQGVSLVALSFVCRDGGLVAVQRWRDPADGSEDTVEVPVAGAECPTTPPPTTTTTEPQPSGLLGG